MKLVATIKEDGKDDKILEVACKDLTYLRIACDCLDDAVRHALGIKTDNQLRIEYYKKHFEYEK